MHPGDPGSGPDSMRTVRPHDAYDTIGSGYALGRRSDPRLAAVIAGALGPARVVVNVGAGTGSYEPRGRQVVAVEPSTTMLEQRAPQLGPGVRAAAEALPLADGCADAAMAVLTVHHWSDWRAGIAEMRRVAATSIVLAFDPDVHDTFWLVTEYIPEIAAHIHRAPPLGDLVSAMGAATAVSAVPVPWDCTDGFLPAHWRRPEAYLDATVRSWASGLSQIDPGAVERGVARLSADLGSGAWHRRHGDLLDLGELDVGFRLLVTDGADGAGGMP